MVKIRLESRKLGIMFLELKGDLDYKVIYRMVMNMTSHGNKNDELGYEEAIIEVNAKDKILYENINKLNMQLMPINKEFIKVVLDTDKLPEIVYANLDTLTILLGKEYFVNSGIYKVKKEKKTVIFEFYEDGMKVKKLSLTYNEVIDRMKRWGIIN